MTEWIRRLRRSQVGALAGDSFYVAIWQGSASIADLAQVALVAHLLGLSEYGRLALVVACVAVVGEFFKLRVGYAATAFGAEAIRGDSHRAAGVFQLTFLVDLVSGIAGFLVVLALAPLVGSDLTGGGGNEHLLVIAALGLIASSPDMTFTSILRLLDRFRLVALYSAVIELGRVVLVLVGLLVFESLTAVVVAVVLGKLVRGVASALVAGRVFHRAHPEARLTRRAMNRIPPQERREMYRMMMHTNFVGYGRLAQVHLPTLLLGGLVGTRETGIYKLGLSAAAPVGRLADPASAALMPRFSRLWADHRLSDVRRLIRQVSLISIPTMLVALAVLLPLREPILELLGAGESVADAAGVLIVAATAQALYGAVFWNRTLLFAARRAGIVSAVVCSAAAVQIALVLALVPSEGAIGAAWAMLASQLVVNVCLSIAALRTLRREERRVAAATPVQASA